MSLPQATMQAVLLDPDVWHLIFSKVGHNELCRSASVCKQWHEWCASEPLWRSILLARWPYLKAVAVACSRAMFRKLTPGVQPLRTLLCDVLLTVELQSGDGRRVQSEAATLDGLVLRDDIMAGDDDEPEDSYVVKFPERTAVEALDMAMASENTTLTLVRKRDGKVVRFDLERGLGHTDGLACCLMPSNNALRTKLRLEAVRAAEETREFWLELFVGNPDPDSVEDEEEQEQVGPQLCFRLRNKEITWSEEPMDYPEGDVRAAHANGIFEPRDSFSTTITWSVEMLSLLTWE